MNLNSCRGFTLMEVWTAIVVMSVGMLAVDRMFDFFNRMKTAERNQTLAFESAVTKVESFVLNPPPCNQLDSVLPGTGLAWADVLVTPEPPAHPVHFRRLVQCKQ